MNEISHGSIFVLMGTSSTGKSSVAQALKAADSSWVETGPDLAGFYHMADMIKETFPEQYEEMSRGLDHTEIAHAVVDVYYKAKEGKESSLSFLQWKRGQYTRSNIESLVHEVAKNPAFASLDQSMYVKETAEKVNEKMIDFIRSNSDSGSPVFVDGLGPDMLEAFLQQTKGYPVKVGLAYLPFHLLVGRVTQRNEVAILSGDDAEVRSYKQITEQFLDHYKCAETGDPIVGRLSLEKVNRAFDKMRPRDKQEAEALVGLKVKMIEEYKLDGGGKVHLSSRFHYNVLVQTKRPPEDSIQHITKNYV